MPWKKKRIIAQIIAPKIFDQFKYFSDVSSYHTTKKNPTKRNLYEHTPFLFQFLFEFIKDIHIYHQFLELFSSDKCQYFKQPSYLRDMKTTTSLSNMGYIRTIFPDKNVNGCNF